jgi:predicted nuclease of restriction endonuclease-like RecB superfamily
MLTGNLVRVRYARDRVIPYYLNITEARWQMAAERLLDLFRGQQGRTRGELEDELTETFGGDTSQLVHRGLAKLLEDRCEFEVVSGQPPEKVREVVFRLSAQQRRRFGQDFATLRGSVDDLPRFYEASLNREAVLREAAAELEMSPEAVDQALFADLKSEQRLTRFKDTTPERLLQRYNVALAQAVLLRSTQVRVTIRGEKPARFRQLLRLVKFHRLICEVKRTAPESCELHFDGPLSLFTATQKYGLQLALFLPAVLHCRDFELEADLKWGAQRKPKRFVLSSSDGLVSHSADTGTYVPPELEMFVELFRKRIEDWDIAEETGILPLGDSFWVPDFRLTHRATGATVLLEVLGFWRRASAERHLERLGKYASTPFVLAVSDQLHIDDTALEGLSAGIHRFRQMPLPDEVARLASEHLARRGAAGKPAG